MWMIPSCEWMKAFGYSVESVRTALLHGRNNLNTKEILGKIMDSIKVIKVELRR